MNGKVHDIQELDFSINAITDYSWLGNEEEPEPTIILECHINPNVGYCAVFDVEKMDYIFGTYGTGFTYNDYSATSMVYAFEDSVYNYWGDRLYQNEDDSVFINNLEYDENTDSNAVLITLSSKQDEKRTVVTRVNYHRTWYDDPIYELSRSSNSTFLSEFNVDLTHDGKKEKLSVFKVENAGDQAFLEISDTDGTTLWLEAANTSHAGSNSVYHCKINKEDYLLVFNPYQCTGTADFTYELFYLSGKDTIDIVDCGYYSFSYEAKDGEENAFNEEKFKAFADKLNNYLQSSYILMSTEEGVLKYSTEGNYLSTSDRYETEKWISEIKKSRY